MEEECCNSKKKVRLLPWYSTSFWVHGYILFYMIMTIVSCLPRILAQIMYSYTGSIPEWLPEEVTVPLEVLSWGLLIITSVYAGLDRASFAVKSSMTEIGTADMGDPAKLRRVILYLGMIFFESYALNLFFGRPFPPEADVKFPGASIPLTETASALVSAITIYVSGNKAIRLVANVESKYRDPNLDNSESTIVNDQEQ